MSWWNRQRFSLVRTVAPAKMPISRQEALKHARIYDTRDIDLVDDYLQAATDHAESYQRRALIMQTWQLKLDNWPWYAWGYPAAASRVLTAPVERFWEIQLPRPRLQSVTYIKYIDINGVEQTWDASKYTVDTASEPGMIYPVIGQTWPVVRAQPFPITIVYVCGYGADGSAVPATTRQWIRLAVCEMFENRELVQTDRLGKAEVPSNWDFKRSLLDCESLGDLIAN